MPTPDKDTSTAGIRVLRRDFCVVKVLKADDMIDLAPSPDAKPVFVMDSRIGRKLSKYLAVKDIPRVGPHVPMPHAFIGWYTGDDE